MKINAIIKGIEQHYDLETKVQRNFVSIEIFGMQFKLRCTEEQVVKIAKHAEGLVREVQARNDVPARAVTPEAEGFEELMPAETADRVFGGEAEHAHEEDTRQVWEPPDENKPVQNPPMQFENPASTAGEARPGGINPFDTAQVRRAAILKQDGTRRTDATIRQQRLEQARKSAQMAPHNFVAGDEKGNPIPSAPQHMPQDAPTVVRVDQSESSVVDDDDMFPQG